MRTTFYRLAITGVASALLLTGCATNGGDTNLSAALPTSVPPDAKLSISVNTTRVQLQATGQLAGLPFTVTDWPVVQAGPDVVQAFRGGALDLATNAGIPPIHARATGVDAKIVGVKVRTTPLYKFLTAPGSNINSVADLRGKRIGFSPGQAQGVVVLRTLQAAGIGLDQVKLVDLSSTQFLTALQGGQIDAAPSGEPIISKYLAQYRDQGAKAIETTAVDALTILWAPTAVLQDSAKLAAVAEFVKIWARNDIWAWEHPQEWADAYYVKDQKVSPEDAQRILTTLEKPYYPANWDEAIRWEQETVDLVTESGYFGSSFDAATLFDRRFEKLASEAVPASYRTKEKP
ncbi:ABC transporter substrate-binding protein [Nocardia sp. NPDC050712]|uniref:ABC transporter substrate-binding protein n=1 Tax=Nocardia sp. NPDC050712 TaxID=3155518 RepID=UPI0033D3A96E